MISYDDSISFGRVVVSKSHRGGSIAKDMMTIVLEKIKSLFDCTKITISAQTYLINFYSKFWIFYNWRGIFRR